MNGTTQSVAWTRHGKGEMRTKHRLRHEEPAACWCTADMGEIGSWGRFKEGLGQG